MSEDELILTHILKCSRAELLSRGPALTEFQQKEFDAYKARRAAGEPLQYILGSWDFCGLEFRVDPRVLVPRPETEGMAARAIKEFLGTTALDLGTGSGNIAVTLAKSLPYVKVTTVDVSVEALAVAMANAQRHGVASRVEFVHADMMDYLESCTETFDLIISNPPYIPSVYMPLLPADVRQEPVLALDGGEDGMDFHRILIKHSPPLLRTGGCFMMEFGDGQAQAVEALVRDRSAYSTIEIVKDLAGKDRFIMAIKR